MTAPLTIAEGRRQDLLSKLSRGAAQLIRTRAFRPAAPTPLVSFTFDDIPDSAATTGAAMLGGHQARGTFYVAAGLMGRHHGGNTFASAETIGALAAQGHEIGCHTFSHPDVQRLSAAAIAAEIERNAQAIRSIVPKATLSNFAYPYGSVGLPQKQFVQRRFRSARGTRQGLNRGTLDLGQLPAYRLYDHLIDAKGLDALIAETMAARAWLIFYTHDIADRPTEHGCTPGLLEAALASCRRQACPVVTVEAALDRLAA